VIRPLEQLSKFAQQVGETPHSLAKQQDLLISQDTIVGLARRPEQIGYLSLSLTRMSAAIQARIKEHSIENAALYANSDMRMQEQTRRIEALIHSLQDGLILEDLRGNVLYANRRVAELAGMDGELNLQVSAAAIYERILERAIDQNQVTACSWTWLMTSPHIHSGNRGRRAVQKERFSFWTAYTGKKFLVKAALG
jgi:PAS domain-containing protein